MVTSAAVLMLRQDGIAVFECNECLRVEGYRSRVAARTVIER